MPPASAGSTSTRWSTKAGRHDLSQLRALQDWFLRFELKTLPNVAEVASLGGMVRQYQIVPDPVKLAALGITHQALRAAIEGANQETGGAVLTLAEAEFMVRASGYLKTLDDFRAIPLKLAGGVPVPWAMWRRCSLARKCAAAWRNSTARARPSAAW